MGKRTRIFQFLARSNYPENLLSHDDGSIKLE